MWSFVLFTFCTVDEKSACIMSSVCIIMPVVYQFIVILLCITSGQPKMNHTFSCRRPVLALSRLTTFYDQYLEDRVFVDFNCLHLPSNNVQGLEQEDVETCGLLLFSSDPSLNVNGTWVGDCPGHGYITGFDSFVEKDIRRYNFHCCQNKKQPLIFESCFQIKQEGPNGSLSILLGIGDVVHGIRLEYNPVTKDHVWAALVCVFESQSHISNGALAYSKFPVGLTEPFGYGEHNSYTGLCPRSQTVSKLESVWGYQNHDRGFHLSCNYTGHDPLPCMGTRIDAPEKNWRNPRNWHKAGCMKYEVLIEFSSHIHDGVRRFRFTCCMLDKPIIGESTCIWITPNSDANFVIEKQDKDGAWIFRGVQANLIPADRDRYFRFELCQVKQKTSVQTVLGMKVGTINAKTSRRLHPSGIEAIVPSTGLSESLHNVTKRVQLHRTIPVQSSTQHISSAEGFKKRKFSSEPWPVALNLTQCRYSYTNTSSMTSSVTNRVMDSVQSSGPRHCAILCQLHAFCYSFIWQPENNFKRNCALTTFKESQPKVECKVFTDKLSGNHPVHCFPISTEAFESEVLENNDSLNEQNIVQVRNILREISKQARIKVYGARKNGGNTFVQLIGSYK